MSKIWLSRVERRKRNVTIMVLARLTTALGTSPDRLLVPDTKRSKQA